MKRLVFGALLAATSTVAIGACGGGGGAVSSITAPSAAKRARWAPFVHLRRPLDVVGPRADGSMIVAADRRLLLMGPTAAVRPFPSRYVSLGGEEPYVAPSPGGCFGDGTVYALRLTAGRGVAAVAAGGGVRRLSMLSAPGLV